jgi:hypothetical protein
MNTTSENSNDDNITTDYNNSESNLDLNYEQINNISSVEDNHLNDESEIVNQSSDQYTQLFIDNPDNPFYKCKINKLDYDTDDEDTQNKLRIVVIWNYEFNYDFFNIINIKCYMTKNTEFKNMISQLREYRNNSNTTTGILLKLKNNGLKLLDSVHVYLIVYYDNAKCNIEFYGLFDQELDEEKLLLNISNESIYGKTGKVISNTSINSTGGEGFIVIHNLINIE